ncbi:MAG: hypothetical protein ACR2MX_14350 [Cyclobacteriaceae bacterium]
MQKALYLLMLMALVCPDTLFAQSYGTAAGLRLGNNNIGRTAGLSVQQRVMKNITVEGILQTDFSRNTTFHALVERHQGILTKRLNFYVGTGLSFGKEESTVKNRAEKEIITSYGNTTLGLDAILGLEFTVANYNLSLDYKPNFNLAGKEQWYRGQIGISARSVLVKGAAQNKRRRQRDRIRKQEDKAKAKDDREKKPWLQDFFNKTFKKEKE